MKDLHTTCKKIWESVGALEQFRLSDCSLSFLSTGIESALINKPKNGTSCNSYTVVYHYNAPFKYKNPSLLGMARTSKVYQKRSVKLNSNGAIETL